MLSERVGGTTIRLLYRGQGRPIETDEAIPELVILLYTQGVYEEVPAYPIQQYEFMNTKDVPDWEWKAIVTQRCDFSGNLR